MPVFVGGIETRAVSRDLESASRHVCHQRTKQYIPGDDNGSRRVPHDSESKAETDERKKMRRFGLDCEGKLF